MQIKYLLQSFYFISVVFSPHKRSKYIGREFSNTHCPIQIFAVVYSKAINPKLPYIVTIHHYPYRIWGGVISPPSCYKPSSIRIKMVDIVCAYLCSTVSKFELWRFHKHQFWMRAIFCCLQYYPIIPTIPARQLPGPFQRIHPTRSWSSLVWKSSRWLWPRRALCADCTCRYNSNFLCHDETK